MRVMVFAKATEDSEKGVPPTAEAFEAMDRFTEELVKAGVMVAGAGLKPMSQSRRIVFDGDSRTVIEGPIAEAREQVAGFSIWEVKDMDEAVAWVKRHPNPMAGRCEIEIRPFLEAEDVAEFLTPEELSMGNGLIELFTFVMVILGLVVPPFLKEWCGGSSWTGRLTHSRSLELAPS